MSMDRQEQNAFYSAIRDGDWNMSMGDSRELNHYYSDAKDHYYRAMQAYDKAYDIAREADDYSGESEASSKYRDAESSYRSISGKEWEYAQKQKENDYYER